MTRDQIGCKVRRVFVISLSARQLTARASFFRGNVPREIHVQLSYCIFLSSQWPCQGYLSACGYRVRLPQSARPPTCLVCRSTLAGTRGPNATQVISRPRVVFRASTTVLISHERHPKTSAAIPHGEILVARLPRYGLYSARPLAVRPAASCPASQHSSNSESH